MTMTFLLLEITDPEVNALLWRMRELISGRRTRTAVHLTLRGPYTSDVEPEVLERSRKAMAGDVLKIYGVGRFSNPDGEVVFMRVDSPHLQEVWWKPSFPGFQPHISIYRGSDKRLAEAIEAFLSEEKLEIMCAEYRLVWHRTGQRSLFDSNEPTVSALNLLVENGRLDPDVLDRLSDAMDAYRAAVRQASDTP